MSMSINSAEKRSRGNVFRKLARCFENQSAICADQSGESLAHLRQVKFTPLELQQVFESILEKNLEKKSFRRRIYDADILKETADMRRTGSRPARLYRIKDRKGGHFLVGALRARDTEIKSSILRKMF